MANIREIARLAGVSVSTVSRVLNEHPYVSESKRSIVLKTMEKMDYRPNINAIHLSKGETKMVGVVLPTINHPYFSDLLEGIAEEAMEHNFQVVLFQTDYRTTKELEALEQLRGKLIDGVIFCSRAIDYSKLLNYKKFGPIVLCEDLEQIEFPAVSIEHINAFSLGLDYLVSKGHRQIAIGLGRLEGTNSQKRISAYKLKLDDMSEPVRNEWIMNRCLTIQDGKKVIQKYLEWEEKPTAFIVGNDQVAAGLITEAAYAQLKVPADFAVLSFDNHPISEIMGITTIEIPTKRLGLTAFKAFLEKMKDADFTYKKILPFKLHERKTV